MVGVAGGDAGEVASKAGAAEETAWQAIRKKDTTTNKRRIM